MPGEGKIEEIRVQLALEPNGSFKNQAVKVSGLRLAYALERYWGSITLKT